MANRAYRLHDGRKGAALAIRVTPRASKNEIVELLYDGSIRVRLTAPPVEDKANQALREFLAEVLGVPKTKIEIVAGENGRDKLVSVLDVDAETVHRKILEHLP